MEGESQQTQEPKKRLNLRFWKRAEANKNTPSLVETAKYKEAEDVVLEGVSLLKEGKYKEATEYFQSADNLTRLGFQPYAIHDPGSVRITQEVTSPELVKFYADIFAQKSKLSIVEGKIKISQIIDFAPVDGKLVHFDIPPELWNEFALVCAEEYSHGLQYLRGDVPLEGLKDSEADVALYLHRKGVNLTDNFLNRYPNRRTVIEQEKGRQNITIPVASSPQ